MKQILGSIACGAVLLAGVAACSDEPDPAPAGNEASEAPQAAPEDPVALLKTGIEQGQAGRVDEAKGTFERVIAIDGNNKFAWFNLGYIAHTRNDVGAAVANYDRALGVDTSYRPALYNKALLLEESNATESMALYERILADDDTAAGVHLRLGLLRVKEGDKDGARSAFRHAVELDSELTSAVPKEFRSALKTAESGR
ncbi:tetratricopeptide repeat protein [Plantactinospora sp. GCM10030261]|uniref:tetratricopeptide repeat protein n=1 Tax=Plantactinospora sp. GCM10030261 TaxID=3273420 RepID=UPI00361720FC